MGLEKKELISCHGYSDDRKVDAIVKRLEEGQHLALVSDAGTPCISDPGYKLLYAIRNTKYDIRTEVIPGPSAFLAALSISGLPINQFVYIGFPPLKKGRQTLWASLHDEKRTVVLYESVHRIEKTLNEIADALQDQPERAIVIARELTKIHEEVVRTTVVNLQETVQSLTQKGEFAIVIGPLR